MSRRLTTEEFIQKATEVHKGKYLYDKVVYVNSKTKIIITCPIHGDFFQNANSHLVGSGCPKCGIEKISKMKTKWTYETCKKESKKYNSRSLFHKSCVSAYASSLKNGWLDEFFPKSR